MKIYNQFYSLIIAVGLMTMVGCDPGDFGDTNVNPDASEVPVTSALLANAIASVDGLSSTSQIQPALYVQYFSETQYPGASLYQAVTSDPTSWYSGPLEDLQNIININSDEATKGEAEDYGSNANQIAIATILKSYYILTLSDMYGDLPYTEALKGGVQVAYDTQESIYTTAIADLKAANAMFDSGRAPKGDILFNGDIDMWKKFSNTVRLLAALKLKDRLPSVAQSEMSSAYSAGVMMSTSEAAIFDYPGGAFRNRFFNLYNGRQDYAISDVMVNVLESADDPRLPAYGQLGSSGVLGVPYGYTRDQLLVWTDSNPAWSYALDASFRQENSPLYLFTPSEVLFALAEAADEGWISGSGASFYKSGIEQSWTQWNVGGDINTYIANNPYNADNLALQRWIAIYPNGVRGWSEWRRTDAPALTPTPNAVSTAGTIPTRFIYNDSEYNINKENVEAAAARITGGDKQEGLVWWDVD